MNSIFLWFTGKAAGEAFRSSVILSNPIADLMMGVLVTVLLQSSSTTTSIVVALVAADSESRLHKMCKLTLCTVIIHHEYNILTRNRHVSALDAHGAKHIQFQFSSIYYRLTACNNMCIAVLSYTTQLYTMNKHMVRFIVQDHTEITYTDIGWRARFFFDH